MRELLLITVNGQRFATERDSVDVRQVGALHRLPLAPDWLAGIALVDGRTVTLADLAVCLQLGRDRNGSGTALMLKGSEKISGFVVNGDAVPWEAADEAFLPVPGALGLDCIASCVNIGGDAVPVLDLPRICSHLLAAQKTKTPLLMSGDAGLPDVDTIRLFSLEGQVYGLPASCIETTGKPGRLTLFPQSPDLVRGVTIHDDRLLPVIDLSSRLSAKAEKVPERMLVARFGNDRFGLLIDEDHGSISAPAIELRDLPLLARCDGFQKAFRAGEHIIPLLDMPALLAPTSDQEPSFRFNPDSAFPSLFMKQDVEVTEFSLLGLRHALPKCEVADIVPLRPYRSIPNTIPVVLGVSVHQNELLPVLDLALIFGRRSPVTTGCSLILLQNGDFRAFVMTDNVFGDVHLPRDVHRELPIMLSYPVVYGCYPMYTGVRLILNVPELVQHFHKADMLDVLPSLVPEIGQRSVVAELAIGPAVASGEPSAQALEEDCFAPVVREETQPATGSPEQVEEVVPLGGERTAEGVGEAGTAAEAGTVVPGAPVSIRTVEETRDAAAETKEQIRDVPAAVSAAHDEQQDSMESERVQAEPSIEPVPSKEFSSRVPGSLYSLIAIAVLVALFLLFGRLQKPDVSAPQPAALKQKPTEEIKPKPAAMRPTLELEIPRSMPVAIDTYIIVDGDTLWSVSERFTGNPYNYPKIAGENRIADPDLIFPGQKIRLIRK